MALSNVTIAWGPGAHAVIGGHSDGGRLLLALAAGAALPARGRVRVLERPPTDAETRTKVAHITLEPVLPEALRVEEILATAARIRGEPVRDAAERLRPLGVETLAKRTARSLSVAEARAVAVSEALTSTRVAVVLVEEPFVAMDPRAAPRLAEALRAKAAREGSAIVVTTASRRDANELADDGVQLSAGAVVEHASGVDSLVRSGTGRAGLRVVLRDAGEARSFVAELARAEAIESIENDGSWVVARAVDPVALARAAGHALANLDVHVAEMRLDPPPFDEVEAAAGEPVS
jgi:ABC-type multidrug transport system ATPase subunit